MNQYKGYKGEKNAIYNKIVCTSICECSISLVTRLYNKVDNCLYHMYNNCECYNHKSGLMRHVLMTNQVYK